MLYIKASSTCLAIFLAPKSSNTFYL